MINYLNVEGYYIDYGRPFSFEKGSTAIIGRNESGKSSLLEMIRFALFGSKALRRPTEDYKKLKVTLGVTINGTKYKINRSTTNATLFLDNNEDTKIAAGTKPVNQAIVQRLGYNMDVFDTANCCNQHDVLALSQAKAGDRKAMIDQTIGLNVIDVVTQKLTTQISTERARAVGLSEGLGPEPEAPSVPEVFQGVELPDLNTLKLELDNLRVRGQRASMLRGVLSIEPVVPVKPERPKILEGYETTPEALETLNKSLTEKRQALTTIQALEYSLKGAAPGNPGPAPVEPVLTHSLEELVASTQVSQQIAKLHLAVKNITLPKYAEDYLECMSILNKQKIRWNEKQHLLKAGSIECPNCHHTWHKEDSRLAEYADLTEEPERSTLTDAEIHVQRSLIPNIAQKAQMEQAIAELMTKVIDKDQEQINSLNSYKTEKQIWDAQSRSFHDWEEKVAQTKAKLATFNVDEIRQSVSHLEQVITAINSYNVHYTVYVNACVKYQEQLAKREEAEKELKEYEGVDEQIYKLNEQYTVLSVYLSRLQEYSNKARQWKDKRIEIDTIQESIVGLMSGRKALQDLKVKVKSFVLPSLNKVASTLIYELTGGQHYRVALTDDFDILMDDKAIEAYSGSAKVTANLALRLGLSQVLTSRVFSVFMGDELDGSMDEIRAANLQKCFNRLKGSFNQVFLVTHKVPEADQYINLSGDAT